MALLRDMSSIWQGVGPTLLSDLIASVSVCDHAGFVVSAVICHLACSQQAGCTHSVQSTICGWQVRRLQKVASAIMQYLFQSLLAMKVTTTTMSSMVSWAPVRVRGNCAQSLCGMPQDLCVARQMAHDEKCLKDRQSHNMKSGYAMPGVRTWDRQSECASNVTTVSRSPKPCPALRCIVSCVF
jgi:hypothetical protein